MIITNISNIMLMSTSERKYEFGILKAIGLRNEQIVYLVILEAFLISAIALIVGIIIGTWGAIIFDYMFDLNEGAGFFFAPAKITPGALISASILTLVIGTCTAVYPALRASRLNTIEILRCE
jgi:putative ABC transport system permease protein